MSPAPTTVLQYGAAASQAVDLFLPKTPGPHPVVILIHGGCWQADLPGVELMDYLAADLRDRGYAVWNIEYRRIGHPGAVRMRLFGSLGIQPGFAENRGSFRNGFARKARGRRRHRRRRWVFG